MQLSVMGIGLFKSLLVVVHTPLVRRHALWESVRFVVMGVGLF
jgi:hypothetical protein